MSRALKAPPPDFEQLSIDEQIEYVQALWDAIAANAARVPVPAWHRAVLDERMTEAADVAPWEDVRDELRRR
ncbi:MAG: addiction module protein [Sandaracinaceae bacterium]|nr:addiction module protein [Sandaracinaceae bacterium]